MATMRCRVVALLLLVSTVGVATTAVAGQYNKVISIGDPMPSFSNLPSISGKAISSADITTSVVVLISMANHCPWSRGGEADLIKLVDAFRGKSVRIIAFSVNDDPTDSLEKMKERAHKRGFNFDYMRDESQELGRQLGATRTPEYYVFNKNRKLVYTGLLNNSPATLASDDDEPAYTRGKPKVHYVADAINAALAGKPVPIKETRAHGCTVIYRNNR